MIHAPYKKFSQYSHRIDKEDEGIEFEDDQLQHSHYDNTYSKSKRLSDDSIDDQINNRDGRLDHHSSYNKSIGRKSSADDNGSEYSYNSSKTYCENAIDLYADPNALFLAKYLDDKIQDQNDIVEGKLASICKSIYDALFIVKVGTKWFGLFVFFYIKPAWCENLKDVDDYCQLDHTGVYYYPGMPYYLSHSAGFWIIWGIMVFAQTINIMKFIFYKEKINRSIRYFIDLSLIVVSTLWHFQDIYKTVPIPAIRIFYIVFLLLDDKHGARRNFGRIMKIFIGICPLYLMMLVLLTIYTCIFSVTIFNFDKTYKDAEDFYTLDFSSFWRRFSSLVMLYTTSNSPDIFINNPEKIYITAPLYCMCTLINHIMCYNLQISYNFNEYRNIYVKELEYIKRDHFLSMAVQKLNKVQVWDLHDVLDEFAKLDVNNKDMKPILIINSNRSIDATSKKESKIIESSKKLKNVTKIAKKESSIIESKDSKKLKKVGKSAKKNQEVLINNENAKNEQGVPNTLDAPNTLNLTNSLDLQNIIDIPNTLEVPSILGESGNLKDQTSPIHNKSEKLVDLIIKEVKTSRKNSEVKSPQQSPTRFGFGTYGQGMFHKTKFMKLKNLIQFNIVSITQISMRIYIIITPLLLTMDSFNYAQFIVSYIFNIVLMLKLIYLMIIWKKQYIYRIITMLDIIFVLCVTVFGAIYWMTEQETDSNKKLETWEILWSLSSFGHFFGVLGRLGQFKKFRMIYSLFRYSTKILWPFIFTMLIFYYIMALVGESLFGGIINSTTIDTYMQRIGPGLSDDYIKVNWNDHTNSLIFCYSLSLGNNYLVLMNMTLVNLGTSRNWGFLFFLWVFVMTKMLLLNIFSGFFISIFQQFYGRDEMQTEDGRDNMAVTKSDIKFKMANFIVSKSNKILATKSGEKEKS